MNDTPPTAAREAYERIGRVFLSDDEMAQVERYGNRTSYEDGEHLFRVGDRELGVHVLLSGAIFVYDKPGGKERELATLAPKEFLGDVAMLTGSAGVANARAVGQTEVIELPREKFARLLADVPALGEMMTQAFVVRRKYLESLENFSGLVRVIGREDDTETYRLREFLSRNQVPYQFHEPGSDAAAPILERHDARDALPLVTIGDDHRRVESTVRALAEAVGIRRPIEANCVCDLAIIGGGPAGLAAAVYAASEGLKTVIFDQLAPGGQAGASANIENYPGFLLGQTGADITQRMFLQAVRFGTRFFSGAGVTDLRRDDANDEIVLEIDGEETARAVSVLIATGAEYRRLNVDDRDKLEGRGVYYVATEVEAKHCGGETVVVVGGGNSAGQAIMFLAERAKEVIVLVRGESIEKGMSSYLSNRILKQNNVTILPHHQVKRMIGDDHLSAIEVDDTQRSETKTIETRSLFSFIGARPCTAWLPDTILCDERGQICIGADLVGDGAWPLDERKPFPLETSMPGVFAAGDVRSGSTARVSSAAGDGAFAVTNVWRHRAARSR